MIILCLEFIKINFKCVNKKFNNFNKQIILFIKWAFSVILLSINFERNFVFVDFGLRWKMQVRVDCLQHLTLVKSKNFKKAYFQTNDMRTCKSMKTMFIATKNLQHMFSWAMHSCAIWNSPIQSWVFLHFIFITSSILRCKLSYSFFIFSTGICANLSSNVLQSSSIVAGLHLTIHY